MMWSESNVQSKITLIWIICKIGIFCVIFQSSHRQSEVVANLSLVIVRTTPYGLQACSDDVLRQQEVSQLWLHSQTEEKVRWGENRWIRTVADCLDLDAFTAFIAFTPGLRRQCRKGHHPITKTSPKMTIQTYYLDNNQEISENLLVVQVDCFGSFAARQQPRRHRYFCNFGKFFVFNSFDEEIYWN